VFGDVHQFGGLNGTAVDVDEARGSRIGRLARKRP
jgi:hypothetical protein